MAGDINIDTKAIDSYARAMKAAPQTLKREIITGVNRITTAGEGLSKKYIQTDTHHAQRSLTMSPAREAGGVIRGAWGTNVPYRRVLEEGRRPGAPMPPSVVLLGWMRRHGIPESQEFVVRRAIGRKGTVGSRFMQRSRAEVKPLARREIQAAIRRTLASIKVRR